MPSSSVGSIAAAPGDAVLSIAGARARRRLVPRRRSRSVARHLPRYRPCGWDARPPGSTATRSSSAIRCTMPPGMRWVSGWSGIGSAPGSEDAVTSDEATVAFFFGDGATSVRATCTRASVFAAAFDAPMFVLPKQPVGDFRAGGQRSRRRLWERSTGYGFPGVRVDGNDACPPARGDPVGARRSRLRQRPGDDRGLHLPDGCAHHVRRPDPLPDGGRGRTLEVAGPDPAGQGAPVRQGLADQEFFEQVAGEADELAARFRAHCIGPKPPPQCLHRAAPPARAAGRPPGIPGRLGRDSGGSMAPITTTLAKALNTASSVCDGGRQRRSS